MPLNREIWSEALKGAWLDPTTTPRYDNPELYDCPKNHGNVIHVMRGEYAITSLRDEYRQMGASLVGPFHYPFFVFSQKGEFGALGLPDTFMSLLLMGDSILDETRGWTKKSALLVAFDRKLAEHFKHEVDFLAPSLRERIKASGREVSLDFTKGILRKANPLELLILTFGINTKLIDFRFPKRIGFIIDLQDIFLHQSTINSESDLLPYFKEVKPGFFRGIGLEENSRQRLKLHLKMRRGEELQKPVCVYKCSPPERVRQG